MSGFRHEELKIAGAKGDPEAFLELIKNGPVHVRAEALFALANSGYPQACEILKKIAKDRWNEHPKARIAALESLEYVFDPASYADFVENFITDESRIVERAARKILSRIDPLGYPRRLARRGCTDHGAMNAYGRARLTDAVALISDFLIKCASSGSFMTGGFWGRAYAGIRALERIGTPEAYEAIWRFCREANRGATPDKNTIAFHRYSKVLNAARSATNRNKPGGS